MSGSGIDEEHFLIFFSKGVSGQGNEVLAGKEMDLPWEETEWLHRQVGA